MATNRGRLPTTRRVAALFLAVGILCPLPAVAEIPRTTAEWLAVYKERQARFDAVEIESHWQRLEGEKIVEEWDQVFYADDLGRLRLQESGRLEKHPTRDNVGLLVDALFAYDGSEYRELEKGWEYALSRGLSREEQALARASPHRYLQGRIEGQIDSYSRVSKAETPLRMADYWFLVCLTNAAQDKVEPSVTASPDASGMWEVVLTSAVSEWGHGCRASIDEQHGGHVTRIELGTGKVWAAQFEVDYASHGDLWLPSLIRYVHTRSSVPGTSIANELRCSVTKVTVGHHHPEEGFLPTFAEGTFVADMRTDAAYRVGEEDQSDSRRDRLMAEARGEFARLEQDQAEYARWPKRFPLLVQYALAGAVAGFAFERGWTAIAARLGAGALRAARWTT